MTGRGVHAFAVATAASTLVLVFVGGLVTSNQAGLAVPDWPLSYGMVMPPMVGGVFYEHGHRMAATLVGFLTVVLAILLHLREERRWVRRLGVLAVVAVIAQGVLGGLTVKFLLPLPVSVGHACLAQAFLCLVVALAVVTSRVWQDVGPGFGDAALRSRAMLATGAIYLQLVLGAVTRHLSKMAIDRDGPRLAIPDFPLAFGRLVPPADRLARADVAFHFAHRLWAIIVVTLAVLLLARVLPVQRPAFRLWGSIMAAAIPLQVTLGAFTVWSDKAVLPTTMHVATGALLLASAMVLTLLSHRLPAAAPHRAAVAATAA